MNPHASHPAGAHAHGHHHHPPAARSSDSPRPLAFATVLTIGFALVEAWGGWVSGSLALLSDAGHMLTDGFSLGLAFAARAYARRAPTERASYGYGRAEVLAAFVNSLLMLAIVAAIVVEAVQRFIAPAPVGGAAVVAIAAAGLGVNLIVARLLWVAHATLNARAALLHVLGDALGSVAAIVAGVVVLATGWSPIDPILSLVVAVLILRATWRLLAQTTAVLMERVPPDLDLTEIGTALAAIDGVVEVHDLHVWSTGAGAVAVSAHLGITGGDRWPEVLGAARRLLAERWSIRHVTLQPGWVTPISAGPRRRTSA